MNTQFETIDVAQLDTVNGGNKFKTAWKVIKKGWEKTKPIRDGIRDYFTYKGVEKTLEGDKKE